MFEKTKLIMLLVFTIDFLAFCVLVGNLYEKMGMSRTVSIIICTILSAILAVVFVIDLFFAKHGKED
jgi:hypothetical protein